VSGVRRPTAAFFLILLIFVSSVESIQAEEPDWQLWSGVFFKNVRPDSAWDFSGEYQVRLRDDMRELKSHFFDFNAFYKATSSFDVNGGYRFTRRPDRNENRWMAGFFWRPRLGEAKPDLDDKSIRITNQVQYQRDDNSEFNEVLVASNSVRFVFLVSKPVTRKLSPFAVAAVMYTWNEEYVGLEKIRFAFGLRIISGNNDRIKIHYVFEKKNSVEPAQFASIFWVRYEVIF